MWTEEDLDKPLIGASNDEGIQETIAEATEENNDHMRYVSMAEQYYGPVRDLIEGNKYKNLERLVYGIPGPVGEDEHGLKFEMKEPIGSSFFTNLVEIAGDYDCDIRIAKCMGRKESFGDLDYFNAKKAIEIMESFNLYKGDLVLVTKGIEAEKAITELAEAVNNGYLLD
jgi:hypothetical protein